MSDSVLTAPAFSKEQINEYVLTEYNIKSTVEELDSDRDQNFKLTDADGNKFILKVSNSEEDYDFLELQNSTVEYLNKKVGEGVCPQVIPNSKGEAITKIKNSENVSFFVRMISFLEGKFWSDIEKVTDENLFELGQMYGRISLMLMNFTHFASHRYIIWDLKNTLDVEKYIDEIEDTENRKIGKHFLMQFKNHVTPNIPFLRTSVLHNDGNDNNIILKEENGKNIVSSIIDFGDMANSFAVNEIAIVIAYAILNQDDVIKTSSKILTGYNTEFKLNEKEIEVLFYLIAARLCISVCMSAHQFKLNPENDYLKISEKPAWDALKELIKFEPRIVENEFRKACGLEPRRAGKDKETIIKKRQKHLGKSLSVSYKKPLKIVKGFGQYLFDENGSAYLDCVNNVCHVGHCHPHVVRAAQEQIPVLNTNTRYLHDNIIEYAERLSSKFPDHLSVVFLVNSGSEANELALRLARTYTNQKDMVVLDHAYHGNTGNVVDISPYKCEGPGGKGLPPYVHKIDMPDVYRGKFKDSDAGIKYANELFPIIEKLKKESKGLAGFIAETVLGVGGQVFLPNGFLKEAFRIIHEAGGVCIADEVQVGFGRVGTHMWGFETQDALPDIVSLGKPIGNGHPLAAVITTEEIADAFNNGMEYFNTFGGNPVSSAIGSAVLGVIEKEALQKNSLETGNYFINELKKLKDKFDIIGDVRGLGLFIGIELVRDRRTLVPADIEASKIIEKMRDRNVLLSTDGPLHNVIKIKPPIVFNKGNVDCVIKNLDEVLSEFG